MQSLFDRLTLNKNLNKKFKILLIARVIIVLLLVGATLRAGQDDFRNTINKAKNQTVYFNAWGGSESINEYIRWAIGEVRKTYGINVRHVKINDAALVVGRILAEQKAGNDEKGSVDLMWINGENFKKMKKNNLLYGPFTKEIPNYKWVDVEGKKSTLVDFSEPVEGLEAPWGMANLVFIYDQAKFTNPPKNVHELLKFAKKHPGMVTYPKPPDFHGTTFLKQLMLELVPLHNEFSSPVGKSFDTVTKPLWDYLDQLHPLLWRKGKSFPQNLSKIHQLLDDGEILISFSFNPNEASNLIEKGEFPKTVRTYVHEEGMIGNTHFLAIPYNSAAKDAAKVFVNFLLSPQAQARKANPKIWGDPTVLKVSKLPTKDRTAFKNIPRGIATLSDDELDSILLEPHASWVTALEVEWNKRYGK